MIVNRSIGNIVSIVSIVSTVSIVSIYQQLAPRSYLPPFLPSFLPSSLPSSLPRGAHCPADHGGGLFSLSGFSPAPLPPRHNQTRGLPLRGKGPMGGAHAASSLQLEVPPLVAGSTLALREFISRAPAVFGEILSAAAAAAAPLNTSTLINSYSSHLRFF